VHVLIRETLSNVPMNICTTINQINRSKYDQVDRYHVEARGRSSHTCLLE
jgi:hypothetical protein